MLGFGNLTCQNVKISFNALTLSGNLVSCSGLNLVSCIAMLCEWKLINIEMATGISYNYLHKKYCIYFTILIT